MCRWLLFLCVLVPLCAFASNHPDASAATVVGKQASLYPGGNFSVEAIVEAKLKKNVSNGDVKCWQLCFYDTEMRMRLTVTVGRGAELLDEAFSKPYLMVDVDSIDVSGSVYAVARCKLYDGVNIFKGDNCLRVENSSAMCTVAVGSEYLLSVASFECCRELAWVELKNFVPVKVSCFEIESTPSASFRLQSGWDLSDLDDIVGERSSQSAAPIGKWKFLDRDTNAKLAEPGGDYVVAVVPHRHTDGCECSLFGGEKAVYDIVYISGARVLAANWKPGMLKGRLYPTGFEGHFALQWFDAEMTDVGRELFADVESVSLLTFRFPLLKSQLRFARVR